MGEERSTRWSRGLVGADRDAATLAERARGGTSLVIAGPRGSGRSYLLRTIAAELERQGHPVIELRTSCALSAVDFGAFDASGSADLRSLRDGPTTATVKGIIVVDDVDSLDVASAQALARGIAARHVTAIIGLRTARPRSIDRPDDSAVVRRTVLDLWLDGLARRIDLSELSDDDALAMIDLFPDAELLDSATRAGIVWRADGSRTLLRQLIIESTSAARAGRDPLTDLRVIARDSRLAIALARHVADFSHADLECLAGIRRLPHLELAVATRLFDAESVAALIAGGLLYADASVKRRLTVNDLVAHEAQRQLGEAHVDALVDTAGARMLAEADEWWSSTVAVSLSERWHRLGIDASGERSYSPDLRTRVALDAAREANDRGDSAHAAAHAARGLRAQDDPALRLEAELATPTPTLSTDAHAEIGSADARRRLARSRAARSRGDVAGDQPEGENEADSRIEAALVDARHATADMDWARAAEIATSAITETGASPASHLRALVAAGTAETFRGRWGVAQALFRRVELLLDARQRPSGVTVRDRLDALMAMLVAHQIAGADGSIVRSRLEREVGTTAREGEAADLTIAGAAAAIAFAGAGHPAESKRELTTALSREPSAVAHLDAVMIELGIADEMATAGRTDEARAILGRLRGEHEPLLVRSRLYVETTVLAAEGHTDEARRAARATAELSRGRNAAALRIRDLFRLVTLGEAEETEVDELVQLAAATDLPLAVTALRRAAARTSDEEGLPVDELRLNALWSTGEPSDSPETTSARPPSVRPASNAPIDDLTAREREIALLADEGLTNREIAARLFLSIRTVESHVYQARMKVGAPTRRALGRVVAMAPRGT
ncbi:LuxR C-terminal-related transcriptional regulator [uncultured Microbacterium sp.]|uniref:helix-turn-helix transcriptional regulator n=1 Tax=uncultured Microbacterium sp. TaxID=191216 RepID=UPI0025E5B482|nr:LuxR C-terminal-related transcriptional regulator [uncultured Microbacterium sp.]